MKKIILVLLAIFIAMPVLNAKQVKKTMTVADDLIKLVPFALKNLPSRGNTTLTCPTEAEMPNYIVATNNPDNIEEVIVTVKNLTPSDQYYDCVVLQSFAIMYVYYKVVWSGLSGLAYTGDCPTNLKSDYIKDASDLTITYDFVGLSKAGVDPIKALGAKYFKHKFVGDKKSVAVVNNFFNKYLQGYLKQLADRTVTSAPGVDEVGKVFVNEGKYYELKAEALK